MDITNDGRKKMPDGKNPKSTEKMVEPHNEVELPSKN